MRITATLIILSFCAMLWSCNKSDVRETPGGYKITYVKKGDGDEVKANDILVIDMVIVDGDDSVWYDNRVSDYPEMVKIGDDAQKATETGIAEAFRLMSKGDSVLFEMKAKDFFPMVWRQSPPAKMDEQEIFTFQMFCRDVFDENGARKFQYQRDSIHRMKEDARYAEAERQMAEYNQQQMGKDTVLIDNYLKGKGVKAKALPSGLRYVLKSEGKGDKIKDGDVVTMKYAGQTLDGREFDSGEYPFTVGQGGVILGWDLIAPEMKQGTSLTVFIPSTLAYGKGGRPPVILPDAILVFDMEVLSIQKK